MPALNKGVGEVGLQPSVSKDFGLPIMGGHVKENVFHGGIGFFTPSTPPPLPVVRGVHIYTHIHIYARIVGPRAWN